MFQKNHFYTLSEKTTVKQNLPGNSTYNIKNHKILRHKIQKDMEYIYNKTHEYFLREIKGDLINGVMPCSKIRWSKIMPYSKIQW